MISVIVPVHNAAELLPRCVESILRQSYRALEIILINDGSTDGSGEVCDRYKQDDERVQVIHQENAGVSAARNAGLDAARGEWIGFVDADDWIEPEMFEKLRGAVLENKKNVAVCRHADYRSGIRISKKRCLKAPGVLSQETALWHLLSYRYYEGYLWNKLYNRSLIQKCKMRLDEDIHFCEDALFNIQLFQHTDGISYLPDILYHHCINKGSAMVSYNHKRMTELEAWRKIVSLAAPMCGKLLKAAKCRYAEAAIGLFYNLIASGQEHGDTTRFLRKESSRYCAVYFTSFRVSLEAKIKNAVKLLCPKLGNRMWRILKSRFRAVQV